jgi:integrase
MSGVKFSKRVFIRSKFRGKERIYVRVDGVVNVSQLWVWDAKRKRYCTPKFGRKFEARRYEVDGFGGRHRKKQYFETLDNALEWLGISSSKAPVAAGSAVELISLEGRGTCPAKRPRSKSVPTFAGVVESFREYAYPMRSRSTCLQYEKMLKLHFDYFMPTLVTEITPKMIDEWLRHLKRKASNGDRRGQRVGFEKELTLLGTLLRYFEKYNDDCDFRFPIKQRHREDMWFRREAQRPDRDLPRPQFERVREIMLELYGEMWWALFTVQWCEALRISEAAALCWEDVRWNQSVSEAPCIKVCRHLVWTRVSGEKPLVESGFKNSRAVGGVKVLPLFPEAFEALQRIYTQGARGYVFRNITGGLLEYRMIQSRYERAFAKAGIEFRGTHALRHGGCREVYNKTGDVALAGLLLGNQDNDSIRVYARRDPAALFRFAEESWTEASGTPRRLLLKPV